MVDDVDSAWTELDALLKRIVERKGLIINLAVREQTHTAFINKVLPKQPGVSMPVADDTKGGTGGKGGTGKRNKRGPKK